VGASWSFVRFRTHDPEFNDQWEKDYVRKTAVTLGAQTARRKGAAEQNVQREDIDEVMGEGGGDEEEDGESEDDNEDGHGSGGAAKRPGTQRRKLISFYFRTGAVVRTTTDNGGSSISKSFPTWSERLDST
jgi:hypothetical protein